MSAASQDNHIARVISDVKGIHNWKEDKKKSQGEKKREFFFYWSCFFFLSRAGRVRSRVDWLSASRWCAYRVVTLGYLAFSFFCVFFFSPPRAPPTEEMEEDWLKANQSGHNSSLSVFLVYYILHELLM